MVSVDVKHHVYVYVFSAQVTCRCGHQCCRWPQHESVQLSCHVGCSCAGRLEEGVKEPAKVAVLKGVVIATGTRIETDWTAFVIARFLSILTTDICAGVACT